MFVFLLCTAVLALVLYISYNNSYWKRLGIPEVPNKQFILGHFTPSLTMSKSFGEVCADLYKNMPADVPVAGAFIFSKAAIVIKDPEVLKCALVRDFGSFHDRGLYVNEAVDPLSGHLFLLNGNRWKTLRNKLSPTFTSGKMKMMFQIVADCAAELGEVLKQAGPEVEMRDMSSRYTTDVIGSCAFGIKCDCLHNPNEDFRQWAVRFVKPTGFHALVGAFCFAFPQVANTFRIRVIPKAVNDYFMTLVTDTVEYRKKNNVERKDFMQLLIQLMDKGFIADSETEGQPEPLRKLTLKQIAAQVAIFFIAGFETSSATMAFALHELALHPDIQDRLRAEIDSTLEKHGGKVTYDCLADLPYLDMVVSETLRKYPVVPVLNREVSHEYEIPGTNWILEKGTSVIIPVLAIHHDPELYPDPYRFDPERFSEENKAQRTNYTYLPFGEGPRICIGQRFGLMQTKLGIIELLSHFSFRPCSKTNQADFLKLDPLSFTLCPKDGSWLKVSPRSES